MRPLLDHHCLFNIILTLTDGVFLQVPSEAWFLEGAADGLILFVSREGKMGVANPLTGSTERVECEEKIMGW